MPINHAISDGDSHNSCCIHSREGHWEAARLEINPGYGTGKYVQGKYKLTAVHVQLVQVNNATKLLYPDCIYVVLTLPE